MKKIFTLLCICCLGFGAMAQLPINLGVHGGISSNRIKFKDIPKLSGHKPILAIWSAHLCASIWENSIWNLL
ncbi:hypothetical protein [Odoribacter splanchnicus]|uniref:hypothetical protein n=1 Tax=Odoribacter splanchnicus TaxID=28118 RepID=UPI00207A8634|nr:hypothetical protein [Odoribacter splanchnicus]